MTATGLGTLAVGLLWLSRIDAHGSFLRPAGAAGVAGIGAVLGAVLPKRAPSVQEQQSDA
jgi:hypothetical protein